MKITSMSDKKTQNIEKSVETPFYGSQEMPRSHSVSAPSTNNGIKTGKPRPTSDDRS